MAITAPAPRPPHRVGRCGDRWTTTSRHPEPCAGPLPSLAVRPTCESSLRSTRPLAVSPVRVRLELGPCSLDPDRSFWSAFAEPIRDQTSPTDFCNKPSTCGQPNPSSRILAGTEASTSFLFLDMPRCFLAEAVECGEPRSVRSMQPQCWFLPLAWVCPTVMPPRTPHVT